MKHGCSLYVGNKDVTITALTVKEPVPTPKNDTMMIDTTTKGEAGSAKSEAKKEEHKPEAPKEQALDKDLKFIPFDSFVKEMRKQCKHGSNSKCQHCTWSQT